MHRERRTQIRLQIVNGNGSPRDRYARQRERDKAIGGVK